MNAADIAHTIGDARREARGWCCRCPLHGGRSVRLGMPRASEWLAIAVGIETTLSVAAACAVLGLSSGGIRSLVLPNKATHHIICADHDASGLGERAARDPTARWLGEGWCVQAFGQCIVEWLNANPSFSPAERCAWCGKAERRARLSCRSGPGREPMHFFTPNAGELGINQDGRKPPWR